MMTKPKALVLLARGTNRDQDAAEALALAGAQADILPLNELRNERKRWSDYQMLVLAGGFSYADALGAGKLLAIDFQAYFAEEVQEFVKQGKAVIGICNGFQTLIRSGILPGNGAEAKGKATLTFNTRGHFECRWVRMRPVSQTCIWTRGLYEDVEAPIAHGEGNFQVSADSLLTELQTHDQVALVYAREEGSPANGEYPANPNGSRLDIAGICNPQGNVLGLMPHPENHIHPWQHPQWTRGVVRCSGLALFKNGVKYLQER